MTEAVEIPVPTLDHVARVLVELEPAHTAGSGPWGERRLIPIVGGHFEGPRMRGVVLPGGADWQVVHANGMVTVDTHYGLRTDDEALIYISTHGVRVATPHYYFRIFATLETGAQQYYWLNERIFVAAVAPQTGAVMYDLYVVL